MGQIYLNNAFVCTFIKFCPSCIKYQPVNRNDPSSPMAPTVMYGQTVIPKGIDNLDELLQGDRGTKYGKMILHVFQQALMAPDGFGPSKVALLYIFKYLDRERTDWRSTDLGTLFGDWWSGINQRYNINPPSNLKERQLLARLTC